MSETEGEGFGGPQPSGPSNYPSDRSELMGLLKKSNQSQEKMTKMWQAQATSINKLTGVMEAFSIAQLGRRTTSSRAAATPTNITATSTGAQAQPITIDLSKSENYLDIISGESKKQSATLSDIFDALNKTTMDTKSTQPSDKSVGLTSTTSKSKDVLETIRDDIKSLLKLIKVKPMGGSEGGEGGSSIAGKILKGAGTAAMVGGGAVAAGVGSAAVLGTTAIINKEANKGMDAAAGNLGFEKKGGGWLNPVPTYYNKDTKETLSYNEMQGRLGYDTKTGMTFGQSLGSALGGNTPSGVSTNAPSATTGAPSTSVPISGAGGDLGKLISSGEGGYGSFNKGVAGDSGGKQMDFSQMSIGDIMQQQSGGPGQRSLFAVGKYQVIPETMKAAVSALNIDPKTKFTPEVQEQIFRDYLVGQKRPEVKDFITGKSTDITGAASGLSKEFASVTDPATGKSHYAGSGGNTASISTERTMASLKSEKVKYDANIAKGMKPDEAWSALSKKPEDETTQTAQTTPLPSATIAPTVTTPISPTVTTPIEPTRTYPNVPPPSTTMATTTQPPAAKLAIGDSIAQGVATDNKTSTDLTKVGASPSAVLANITKADPATIKGKDITLSTGASNNPAQLSLVEQQVKALKDAGAGNVKIMGVGDRPDFAGVNDKLAEISKKTGATFTGPLDPATLGPDRVHPTGKGYAAINAKDAIPPTVATTQPPPTITAPVQTVQNIPTPSTTMDTTTAKSTSGAATIPEVKTTALAIPTATTKLMPDVSTAQAPPSLFNPPGTGPTIAAAPLQDVSATTLPLPSATGYKQTTAQPTMQMPTKDFMGGQQTTAEPTMGMPTKDYLVENPKALLNYKQTTAESTMQMPTKDFMGGRPDAEIRPLISGFSPSPKARVATPEESTMLEGGGTPSPTETSRATAVQPQHYLPPEITAAPTPPPAAAPAPAPQASNMGASSADIDSIPMVIGDNGIIYVNHGGLT